LPRRASVAVLFPGLGEALRHVGGWARRVGLSSTAPAAGGMVIAAVVGSGIMSLPPRLPAPQPPPSVASQVETNEASAGPVDATQDRNEIHKVRKGTETSPVLTAAYDTGGGDVPPRPASSNLPEGSGTAEQPSPPRSDPGPNPTPSPPSGEEPAPNPPPEPSPPPPSGEPEDGDPGQPGEGSEGADPAPGEGNPPPDKGDPKPDQGKDCEMPPPSNGNDKHCDP
jgi:hypothetical protein